MIGNSADRSLGIADHLTFDEGYRGILEKNSYANQITTHTPPPPPPHQKSQHEQMINDPLSVWSRIRVSALTQSTCCKSRVHCELQYCYFSLYSREPFYSRTPWLTFAQDLVIISSIDIDTNSIVSGMGKSSEN